MKFKRLITRLLSKSRRPSFAKVGKDFAFGGDCIFNSPKMMEFGDYCSIGPHAVFYSIYKKIIFGNYVMVGPNVTMVTGDHSIRKIGIPICLNHEKLPLMMPILSSMMTFGSVPM